MIPFNKNIETLEDITKEFPAYKNPLKLIEKSYAVEIITLELRNLVEVELLNFICGDDDLLRSKLTYTAVECKVMSLEEALDFFDIPESTYINEIKRNRKIFKVFKEDMIAKLAPKATVLGLYHFIWSVDHVVDQAVCYGWNIERDFDVLIKRMKKAGFDPWSTTEDTAAQFIESLNGCGYTLKRIRDKEFRVYNPKGNA